MYRAHTSSIIVVVVVVVRCRPAACAAGADVRRQARRWVPYKFENLQPAEASMPADSPPLLLLLLLFAAAAAGQTGLQVTAPQIRLAQIVVICMFMHAWPRQHWSRHMAACTLMIITDKRLPRHNHADSTLGMTNDRTGLLLQVGSLPAVLDRKGTARTTDGGQRWRTILDSSEPGQLVEVRGSTCWSKSPRSLAEGAAVPRRSAPAVGFVHRPPAPLPMKTKTTEGSHADGEELRTPVAAINNAAGDLVSSSSGLPRWAHSTQ